nr:hypothetical protein [Armatimonas sp.]
MTVKTVVVVMGAATGTTVVLSTKTGFSAAIVTSGRLGGAGADCILQQQSEEIEASGEAVFFTQQEESVAFCRSAIMGQAVA